MTPFGRLRLRRGSSAISPTAHYTGQVWTRNALSDPALATAQGRLFFQALEPAMHLSRALGGTSLESFLLARHRAIDSLLERAIEQDGISQVIEVACGMSPRGWRFTQRYGEQLTYVEADLPAMAARKRHALARMGSLSEAHRVVELDALLERGPASLAEAAGPLDRARGLAIITEGLLSYFPPDRMLDMWRRFAGLLGEFRANRYLSDVHVASDNSGPEARVFLALLSTFVRGRVHIHFTDGGDAATALRRSGFSTASVLPASRGAREADARSERVRIIDASA